jgi:hypothetical protein
MTAELDQQEQQQPQQLRQEEAKEEVIQDIENFDEENISRDNDKEDIAATSHPIIIQGPSSNTALSALSTASAISCAASHFY